MIARLSDWFRGRSPREQRLLLVMAGFVLLVFVWLFVLRPLGDHLSDAREQHGRAITALAATRDQADAIAALQRGARPQPAGSIVDLVTAAAAQAGFPGAAVTADGGTAARLTIPAVRAPALFGWIVDLQQRTGLIVDQLSVRTNTDATLAVELSVRGRGA